MKSDRQQATEESYGFLWGKCREATAVPKWHFDFVQEAFSEPIVMGKRGIDAGSGCGYDTFIMAAKNPGTRITSIDLSDGVFRTRELTSQLENVEIIKGSLIDMPFKDRVYDFAYSYGVLHHTLSPERGLSEIGRILKNGAPAFIYLYEDHSDNILKYAAVNIVRGVRFFTVKLPPRAIYFLSFVLSPFVFLLFSLPAKALGAFKVTRPVAQKFPFNFARGPFSLRGDLYDRLSAPVELRFNKIEIQELFSSCGFEKVCIIKMRDRAGWLARGYKK
ncbi:MAG: class I SAM-dependent methyltransferase [Candidatus Omnitrophota bacterium]